MYNLFYITLTLYPGWDNDDNCDNDDDDDGMMYGFYTGDLNVLIF